MLRLVILVALFCATVEAKTNCKQIFDDNSALIGVMSTSNYALSAPELNQLNWASVAVNGDQLTMVTPECKITERSMKELGEDEKRILEQTTGSKLKSNSQNPASFGGSGGNCIASSNSKVTVSGTISFFFGDSTMRKMGDSHYTFKTDSLAAENIDWLLIDNNVVTFIFSDGHIQMRPRSCLGADEQNIVQAMMAKFEQAKAKSDRQRDESNAERARYQQERERERQQRYAQRDRERQQRYQSRRYY